MNILKSTIAILLAIPTTQFAMQAPQSTRFETKPLEIVNGCDKFKTTLKDIETQQEYGSIEYAIPTVSRRNSLSQGWICQLKVNRDHRRKQYGSVLLNFALNEIGAANVGKAFLVAEPSDLNDGETAHVMLPKLIKFYERHGAYVTAQYGSKSAGMMFELKKA